MIDGCWSMRNSARTSVLIASLMCMKLCCYASVLLPINISENSSDNLLNDDQNFTLEDTFQNYIDYRNFWDSAKCKEDYDKADYPYKEILEAVNVDIDSRIGVISASRNTFDADSTGFVHWSNLAKGTVHTTYSNQEKPIECKEIYQRIYPITGKGVDGNMYYIINVKDFRQPTDIITCHKSGSMCGDISTTPENYVFRCKQKFVELQLASFLVEKNITTNTKIVTSFKSPNGCYCEDYSAHEEDA